MVGKKLISLCFFIIPFLPDGFVKLGGKSSFAGHNRVFSFHYTRAAIKVLDHHGFPEF